MFAHFVAEELRLLLRTRVLCGEDVPGKNGEDIFVAARAAEIPRYADKRSVSVNTSKLERFRGPAERHIHGGNADGHDDHAANHARVQERVAC